MEKVKKVTSPELTKNDLKSSEHIKREEEKKDKNSGKKFREEFDRVNKERLNQDKNWFEDNYENKKNENNRLTQEYTDTNISTSLAARNAFLSKIKVNTEIKILQEEKKSKSQNKLEQNRNSGEAR